MTFHTISSRLPDECRAAWLKQLPVLSSKSLSVLYVEGDVTLASLNLGDLSKLHTDAQAGMPSPALIVVDGNLQVEGWIAETGVSADAITATHGPAGLVVLGTLRAQNAVLAGRPLYVSGNLEIAGLLWVDNNDAIQEHVSSNLSVSGTTSASFFIASQDAQTQLRNGCSALRTWNGGDWDLVDAVERAQWFDPRCLAEDPLRCEVPLIRTEVVRLLIDGNSVLNTDVLDPTLAIPFIFQNRDITPRNLLQLANHSRMPALVGEQAHPHFKFRDRGLFLRALSGGQSIESDGAMRAAYFESPDYAVCLTANAERQPAPLLGRLTGKPAQQAWSMKCEFREMTEDAPWHLITADTPEAARALAFHGWNRMLRAVCTEDYARNAVTPQMLRDVLALSVVQPYDDYYSDERCGVWADTCFCAFRQDGALWHGKPKPAMLRVTRTPAGPDGHERRERYFYEIQTNVDGSESVCIELDAEPDNDDAALLMLNFIGGERLDKAVRVFHLAKRELEQVDWRLQEYGFVPDADDEFALDHWRALGLIPAYRKRLIRAFGALLPIPPALHALAAAIDGGMLDDNDLSGAFSLAFEDSASTALWFACPVTPASEAAAALLGVFGKNPDGSAFAVWQAPDGGYPVVFLGSEGENAALACDIDQFLQLLAIGYSELRPGSWNDEVEVYNAETDDVEGSLVNFEFQAWVRARGLAIPRTGEQIVQMATTRYGATFDAWCQRAAQH
ncbi:hypothetical protein ACCQ13_01945 [Xanthomonas sp. NCPPB 1638]|uniref:hypothetical protein n=1 Tax=Xanthomonas TaxID=338 RepID=UPI001331C3C3|nr:hypothetical protein [Xanthomonas cucurbitae]WDM79531.1 hypothetical protein K6980_01915 [Xanthomonas cucurbitae]WDM83221.1 hypothetical protein K6979_01930 [Xanthomonas cucurbitae]